MEKNKEVEKLRTALEKYMLFIYQFEGDTYMDYSDSGLFTETERTMLEEIGQMAESGELYAKYKDEPIVL